MMLDPLKLLIEIGIEKLKKEYISIFLLAKIATSEQLCIPLLPKWALFYTYDYIFLFVTRDISFDIPILNAENVWGLD